MMENLKMPTEHVDEKSFDTGKNQDKAPKEKSENIKLIEKVLEIERQADHIHEKAIQDAKGLPVKAEQDAAAMIDKARKAAQDEASRMVDQAKVQEQSADILDESAKNIQHVETLASSNFNRAVSYVIARVIGRE